MINPTFLRSPNAGVWIVPNDRGEIAEARIHVRDSALNARFAEHERVATGGDVEAAQAALVAASKAIKPATGDAKAATSDLARATTALDKATAALADVKPDDAEAKKAAVAALESAQRALDEAKAADGAAQAALLEATEAEALAASRIEDKRHEAEKLRRRLPVRITTPKQLADFERHVKRRTDVTFVLCGPGSAISRCDFADWIAAAREVVRPEAA